MASRGWEGPCGGEAAGAGTVEPCSTRRNIVAISRGYAPRPMRREPPIDGHGPRIGDLRVSVTDRRNFR